MRVETSSLQVGPNGEETALRARAQQLRDAGLSEAAASAWQALLAIVPSDPEASNETGLIELQNGSPTALPHLATAVRGAPEREKFWLDYIGGLIDCGDREAAAKVIALGASRGLHGAAVDKCAARLPRVCAVEMGATTQLLFAGQFDQAFVYAGELIQRFPGDGFGWKIQSAVLRIRGQFEEALKVMQEGLRSDPSDAEIHANLGSLFNELKRRPEAIAAFRRALALRPDNITHKKDNASVWNGLGVALSENTSEAENAFRHAVALDPDDHETLSNLGITLLEQARLPEAVSAFENALQLKPTFHSARSNLLFCLSHLADISPSILFDAHRKFGKMAESQVQLPKPIHANVSRADRPIRVGFVSGDFRHHALTSFFEPLAAALAKRDSLQLSAYYNFSVQDEVSARLQALIPCWRTIFGVSDQKAAELIRADGIDILIDLSGHTGYNRLPMFAHRPAPLQCSWMGYPGTTGLSAMDYYLTDIAMLPIGHYDDQFTEALVRLPKCVPFTRSAHAPDVSPLPAAQNGFMTFGSFNRPSKISRSVVAAWSRLLRALPDARLLLGGMPSAAPDAQIAGWLTEEGIASNRVAFHQRGTMESYLTLHHQVDVCVDTFPYSGGTTTLHALTMGVPTLTIAGGTAPGRQSACILEGYDLQRFVATDIEDFVTRGVAIAGATGQLSHERASLRAFFPDSDANDIQTICDGVESALRTMWQRWCANLPVAPFSVPAGSGGVYLDELAASGKFPLILQGSASC